MSAEAVTIRPVAAGDLDALLRLAEATGGGMTNLPPDRPALGARIARTAASLDEAAPDGGRTVFLVADGGPPRGLLGVVALFSRAGGAGVFYTYRLETELRANADVDRRIESRWLHLSTAYSGDSEIGSIFTAPAARGLGLGRAIIAAAHLFVGLHRDWFADHIFAEMRGWQGPGGEKPFWDEVLGRFFAMSFAEADLANGLRGNDFIRDLAPPWPLCLDTMPASVRAACAIAHPDGAGARALLEAEGYGFDGHLDPFDLGPCLRTPVAAARSLAAARPLEALSPTHGAARRLLAAGRGASFTALYGDAAALPVHPPPDGPTLALDFAAR